jgi:hypothetical protein
VLDYIEAHPEEWYQRAWICGTTACYAGWTAILGNEGHEVKVPGSIYDRTRYSHIELDGERVHVSDCAAGLLGVDNNQAFELFQGSNSLNTLKAVVREIFGPRPRVRKSKVQDTESTVSVPDDVHASINALIDEVASHQRALTDINTKLSQLQETR